jgi:hypothetical protein
MAKKVPMPKGQQKNLGMMQADSDFDKMVWDRFAGMASNPEDYEAIKRNLAERGYSGADLKTRAAKITNAQRRKQGRPPAKFHRG